LPAQRQWLTHALEDGQQLVVEPWLERELDFSVQLEMGPRDLTLCGYTGLVNDRKGQFRSTLASAILEQIITVIGSGYLIMRPPVYLDERGPMAFTHTSDGEVLPFSEVLCDRVGVAAQSAMANPRRCRSVAVGRCRSCTLHLSGARGSDSAVVYLNGPPSLPLVESFWAALPRRTT